MTFIVTNRTPFHEPAFTPPDHLIPKLSPNYPLHDLTPDELKQLRTFRDSHLPTVLASLTGTPLDNETAWANDEMLLMFLRATKWNLLQSVKRLTATMQWRREYRPTELHAEAMEANCRIGTQVISGFDRTGRPIMATFPRLGHLHKDSEASVRFSIYLIEKAIKMMPRGVTQLTVLTDYTDATMFNGFAPATSIRFLNLLSTHYPERLGTAINYKPSWYLSFLYGVLSPFMDPVTKKKLVFVKGNTTSSNPTTTSPETGGWFNSVLDFVEAEQLLRSFGGDSEFEFNHAVYWKRLTEFKNA